MPEPIPSVRLNGKQVRVPWDAIPVLPPATVGECGRINKATVDRPWEGDTLNLTSPDTGL